MQDGRWRISLPFCGFSNSETNHIIKKLTTHVTVTLEDLINKTIKYILLLPFNISLS